MMMASNYDESPSRRPQDDKQKRRSGRCPPRDDSGDGHESREEVPAAHKAIIKLWVERYLDLLFRLCNTFFFASSDRDGELFDELLQSVYPQLFKPAMLDLLILDYFGIDMIEGEPVFAGGRDRHIRGMLRHLSKDTLVELRYSGRRSRLKTEMADEASEQENGTVTIAAEPKHRVVVRVVQSDHEMLDRHEINRRIRQREQEIDREREQQVRAIMSDLSPPVRESMECHCRSDSKNMETTARYCGIKEDGEKTPGYLLRSRNGREFRWIRERYGHLISPTDRE